MLEVVLNIVWLLIAIGAFLFWRPKGRGTALARGVVGTICRVVSLTTALVLLFPTISVTDDLHQEQAVMEDCTRSIQKARALADPHQRMGKSLFPTVLAALPYFGALSHSFAAGVIPLETPVFVLTLISAHEGRSPPCKS
jgi:hypothetical protein